jgi:peptidoglycan/LPS O-acetylase OafA/YrhL
VIHPEPKNSESSLQPAHFAALDSIRGIAALSVVFFHISWVSFVEELNYVRNSYLMVDLFFVLSGFVMFYSYGDRIKNFIGAARFMWLRFWRLYPLHFAFLVVFFLFECLKAFVQWRFGLVANNPAFSLNNFHAFMGNLFLVQSLHIFPKPTFNFPSWSISVEFYTYVVFAIVVLSSGGKRAALFGSGIICILSLGILVLLGPRAESYTADFGIFRCFAGFFLGVVTFATYENLQSCTLIRSHSRTVGWSAIIALVVFAAYLQLKHLGFSDLAIYPLSAAVVLLVALAPSEGVTRFLVTPPLIWLGTVSYSIYMTHAAVEWGVNQVLRFVTHAKEIELPLHDTPVLLPGTAIGLCAIAATLILVLVVSHFTYAWIEKPFRDWSKTAWPARPMRAAKNAGASSS